MPLVFMACRVLESVLAPRLRQAGLSARFMDYGYHRVPQLMTPALQTELDALSEPSLVVLGYGLCGNGLAGLKAGRHTLLVPRADDCISMLLGSHTRYLEEFAREPGTYYLTKGWLESGSHPLKEHHELLEKYDAETVEWLLDEQYKNYRRLALVAPTEEELAACRPQALEVAEFCAQRWGFRYEEIVGSSELIERLVQLALQPAADDDFLIIPPGGEIKQEMFWR